MEAWRAFSNEQRMLADGDTRRNCPLLERCYPGDLQIGATILLQKYSFKNLVSGLETVCVVNVHVASRSNTCACKNTSKLKIIIVTNELLENISKEPGR